MSNKSDNFYFENLIAAAEISHAAASFLVESLSTYQAQDIRQLLLKMHEFEHRGDEKKHEMSTALAKAFVTPIEREDLAQISQNIDEVTDKIEEILQRFYMDGITVVPSEAAGFAEKLVECCTLMKSMLTEFRNFKKPRTLHEHIVALNRLEEECDRYYLDAMRIATQNTDNTLLLLFEREIYDKMEDCADACEHVGDCVETVVMKNT